MIISKYEDIDGIKIFHRDIICDNKDFNADGLDCHYQIEREHFWFVSRREFILNNFKKFILKGLRIIEIGAGTGNVARYLIGNGYDEFAIGEMHLKGLKYAQTHNIKDCYQFDILRSPFENEFDVVCLFDVLEHINNEKAALENASKMLKKDGVIVLTVPAHMWLWSNIDKASGHKRRYNKRYLKNVLNNAGYDIIDMKYFFVSLVPLFLFRSVINIRKGNQEVKELNSGTDINGTLNKLLLFLARAENKIINYLPNFFGGSLFAIAKKKNF